MNGLQELQDGDATDEGLSADQNQPGTSRGGCIRNKERQNQDVSAVSMHFEEAERVLGIAGKRRSLSPVSERNAFEVLDCNDDYDGSVDSGKTSRD